jgi:4-amino-4-deoxy-L-arabinose transferase-like glycosyltransferase
MLGANNVDLVYSFWQTQLMFGIGTGVFISLALATAHGRRQLGYLFGAGLCAGLAFMTKQTAIIFLFLPVAFLLVVSTGRFRNAVRVKRSSVLAFVAGWAIVVLAVLLWLAANGAFVSFMRQVFGGVSSKGS